MITRKLNIIYCNDFNFIKDKVKRYSYAMRLMCKMIDESVDSNFITKFKERFQLTDIEYRSLVADAKAKITSMETNNENKKKKIEELNKRLFNNKDLTKKEKYAIFNKISFLNKSLKNNFVFGGRDLLQKITREYNKKSNKDEKLLNEYLVEYRSKRNGIPCSIIGEANQKGNRFFDFSQLGDGKVTYKPFKGKKIEIQFKLPKKFKNDFLKLSEMTNKKEISLTISLGLEYIYFTFDEERLNGYAIDEAERRADVREIKKQGYPKEIEVAKIKEIYKKYYDSQEEKKLAGKLKDRCVAIDLNPTNIGFSILDKTNDNIKIIHCGWFDMEKLCVKINKASYSKEQRHQNNKRKYELTVVLKKLFNIARHYKCSQFIMEDLNGDFENANKETNRKVKNLWNRNLLESIIRRRCNENGIKLITINPAYSSFIGNIQYNYVDAVNASIEIGRRGLFKYIKGTFYPHIRCKDLDTMEAKFGIDVPNGTSFDWVGMYKSLKNSFPCSNEFSHRLRTALNDIPRDVYSMFSMNSHCSLVNYIRFDINNH